MTTPDPTLSAAPPPVATDAERLARVTLGRLAEPGDPRIALLVQQWGAPRAVELLRDAGRGGAAADVAARLDAVEPARDLDQGARLGLRYLIPGDPEWPAGLADLAHAGTLHHRGGPPLGLWVRGALRLDTLDAVGGVAVVGSRAATTYGAAVAGQIAATVAAAGPLVVSGAAFGIDVAAHRAALGAGAPTVAVLACGADRAYPAAHRELLRRVAVDGALVSEAAPGCAPQRIRFLARNRLIAALTGVTVVVEAARRSGALNTATWAGRLHRPVGGVPGPVTSGSSVGVHDLLREGAATLVTDGADTLELAGRAGEHLAAGRADTGAPDDPRDRLSVRERQVLDALPIGRGADLGSLARVAGIAVAEVRLTVARLGRAGLAERDEHGWRLAARAAAGPGSGPPTIGP
ncbi:DNA-processing protein DprA [Nocardioides sp.]|uniref:DNA-processing protein DprA n=1 Tax=Nocardioides sp. TaxID=35761 RepID=UPI003518F444